MNKVLLYITVLLSPLTSAFTQTTFPVQVHIDGLAKDTVYLAHYYGSKLFYNDTTVADSKGNFSFKGKAANECGKYAIVLPGPIFFDFMLVEEPMEFRTSLKNPSGDMVVIQSTENKVFFDYLHFLQAKRSERTPHDDVLKDSTSTPLQVERAKTAMKIMTSEVIEYQEELVNSPEDYLFGRYLGMLKENEVPEPSADIEDPDMWRYMWYRTHYWDRVDFTDPRLVRDGSLQTMIERFWGQVLPPDPDTMFVEAVKLLSDVGTNYEMFKYFLHHMTFESESSKLMCMDKVFVNLVNKYYATGMVDWLNEDQLKKIIDRATELKYSLCGEVAHDITLPGIDGTTWRSLHDVEAKYTLLVIWESSCGHCKKELPILQTLYEEWHDKGLEIYAIGNDFETEPWIEYLESSNYSSWIHVSDNPQINAQDSAMALIYSGTTDLLSLNFRTTFDVFSTPKLFLLDEDKKILAKQIGSLQLAEMIYRREGLDLPEIFKIEAKDE
jgi:thiol-disulfide isomerase/thioredoxin